MTIMLASCGENESADASGGCLSVQSSGGQRLGQSRRASRRSAIRRCMATLSSEDPQVKPGGLYPRGPAWL